MPCGCESHVAVSVVVRAVWLLGLCGCECGFEIRVVVGAVWLLEPCSS